MSSEREIKIFVSSPGDTDNARQMVRDVIDRLNLLYRGQAFLNATFWEDRWYSAHDTFQNQIPQTSEFDLVLAIFKNKLGTPLPKTAAANISGVEPESLSGTAYEVLSAINARRSGKELPDILIYRLPENEPLLLEGDIRNKEEAYRQANALQGFFAAYLRDFEGEFKGSYKTYRQIDELQRMLENDLEAWLGSREIRKRAQVWDLNSQGSPFPGLQAFGSDRARIFFGREELIERALRELRGDLATGGTQADQTVRPRFLLLLGASGSGKSSLLRAGVVPRLIRERSILRVKEWRVIDMSASGALFATLAEGLLQPDCLHTELAASHLDDPEALQRQLRGDLETAWRPLRTALDQIAERHRNEEGLEQRPQVELLLVLDQIERSFSEVTATERAAFFDLIARCVQEQLVTVLGALRSDAYDGLQQVPALVQLRASGVTLDVLPMNHAEVEGMLLNTAATCAPPLQFERCGDAAEGQVSLARRLVDDTAGSDALPLLQLTLEQLYKAQEQRQDHVLACADYHGLEAAVTERADAALAQLAPEGREALKPLVLQMIEDVIRDANGEWRPWIKPVHRETFEHDYPAGASLVEALVAARLLVAERGPQGAQVRPTHEALLRIWPQAREVVRLYAEQIHLRSKLEARVRAWQEAPSDARDEYLQLPAYEQEAAAKLQQELDSILPAPMRDFLQQSKARAARAAKQFKRRQTLLVLFATVAAITVNDFFGMVEDILFFHKKYNFLFSFIKIAIVFIALSAILKLFIKIIYKQRISFQICLLINATIQILAKFFGFTLPELGLVQSRYTMIGIDFILSLIGGFLIKMQVEISGNKALALWQYAIPIGVLAVAVDSFVIFAQNHLIHN